MSEEMNMSEIVADWNKLSQLEKDFCGRCCGGKYGAEPHACYVDGEYIALWKNAELHGFVECAGNYEWIQTRKYLALTFPDTTASMHLECEQLAKDKAELVEGLQCMVDKFAYQDFDTSPLPLNEQQEEVVFSMKLLEKLQ